MHAWSSLTWPLASRHFVLSSSAGPPSLQYQRGYAVPPASGSSLHSYWTPRRADRLPGISLSTRITQSSSEQG
ncbi:hypothetical protein LX32DRAFT_639632 [Colletotrichum zoysiae]|uniref:Uncharacterized protein n=1 Tax=Colletotrichum zoysiae TaxID=1216348 RepID=A0AAD9M4N9_9PEZI|nr:hypothetical protein LX32DRAFT_639632 [Colletotrichum zoysiae]